MARRVDVIACLVDGCSIRTAARLLDVHRDTIGRLALAVGEGCEQVHDRLMRDLAVSLLQLDEQWSFVHTKRRNLRCDSPAHAGDQWIFLALDVAHRAIVSYLVGRRTEQNTELFVADLRRRVRGAPRIATDGFTPYVGAIRKAFGRNVSFGQLVKLYSPASTSDAHRRYRGSARVPITGQLEDELINTSLVERANLTTRMAVRRFTRKSNAFSKKLRNHRAAVSLHVAHYNLCRIHGSLRITPAMALGITEHVWSIEELIRAALDEAPSQSIPIPSPQSEDERQIGAEDHSSKAEHSPRDFLRSFTARLVEFLQQELDRCR